LNKLYFGDNLEIMREMDTGAVDLICTDPPFNSGRNYNAFFKESQAQNKSFTDIWTWDTEAIKARTEIETPTYEKCDLDTYKALDTCLKGYDMVLQNAVSGNKGSMRAYLAFMGPRLAEMHRILKDTGSIYLHCDPTASHYLKGMMDAIWDQRNTPKNEFFGNEIVWQRTHAHNDGNQYGRIHDTILFYRKSNKAVWNPIYIAHDSKYIKKYYPDKDKNGHYQNVSLTASEIRGGESGKSWRGVNPSTSGKGRHWAAPGRESWPEHVQPPDNYESLSVHGKLEILDAKGLIYWPSRGKKIPRFKRYLSTSEGRRIQDIITDIEKVSGNEDLGYDTQKPCTLYERMIEASSNLGALVLDPFCGCGTTIDAAQTHKRFWMGIDLTIIALDPMRKRLQERHGIKPSINYEIQGYPTNMQEVRKLVRDENKRHDFSNWAVTRLGLTPTPDVGDGGKDGVKHVTLWEAQHGGQRQARFLAEVKSGHPTIEQVRAFCHTMTHLDAIAGIFITIESVSDGMRQIAADMGVFTHNNRTYPKMQFWQIDDSYFDNEEIVKQILRLPPDWLRPIHKSDRHFGDTQLQIDPS
jgi:DNA modification methylase